MEQKYLPIGSVCTIKGKTKKVMVTGYYSVSFNGNLKIKDYVGCVYPEGLLLPEATCSFNHDDIEQVDFIGYKNEEQKTFERLLDRLTNNEKTEEEKAAEFHKENEMFLTSNSTYSKLLFDENGVVMIADPVVVEESPKKESLLKNIKFDDEGYVISVDNEVEMNNPFVNEYNIEVKQEPEKQNWSIFKNIEFDENGNVIAASEYEEPNKSTLNEIQFDENGTVIAVSGETLKEETDYSKYKFDENGTLIAVGDETLEVKEETQNSDKYEFDENGLVIAVNGGTLKEETDYSKYKFDENGTLIALGDEELEEEIPAIGPGLPGYVAPVAEAPVAEPVQAGGYQFDANGNVIAAPVAEVPAAPVAEPAPTFSNIQFDENGTVISA